MSVDSLVAISWSVLYAAGSVWFYLHCIRPAFRLLRAKWIAHLPFAALSIVPAIVLTVAPDEPALSLVIAVSAVGLLAGWLFPGAVVRATGGVAEAKGDFDALLGWLSPAGEDFDVGDLQAAQRQVDEARRHATGSTTSYVELWDALVREEQERRNGERVSRLARLEAIGTEYERLVLESDPLGPVLKWALVAAVGIVVYIRLAI